MAQKNTPLVLEQKVTVISELFGELFKCLQPNGIPVALEAAQNAGYTPATLPQLVHWRHQNIDQRLWTEWYTALSEEDIGPNPRRIKINSTEQIYAIAHGKAALLSRPQRVRTALETESGLTEQYAARFTQQELDTVLSGHDKQFSVFTIDEFLEASKLSSFGKEHVDYVVVAPFEQMKKTISNYQKRDGLRDNELLIVRAGGVEQARKFLDTAAKVYNANKFGNWHRFQEINPQETHGCLLHASYNDYGGLNGGGILGGKARFLGVHEGAAGAPIL
jgi:hypothetical protein